MPHNIRHKKRYGNLVPRTSKSPFTRRFTGITQTKNLKEEMEKERLRRRLEQFRRAEMASRGLPIPAPVDEGLLRSEEASDALAQVEKANRAAASITQPFPTDFSRGRQGQGGVSMGVDYSMLPGTLSRAHGQDDPQNQRGMRGRPWVWPQDRRKAVHDRNVANDLRKREAEQLALQSRRPTPEPWMTGRTGLLDPNWTDATAINVPPKDPRRVAERAARDRLAAATLPAAHGQDDPAGYEGWSPGELDELLEGQRNRRYDRLTAGHPSQASGAVPDYGYWQNLENRHMLRRRAKEYAESQRDQAAEFEHMEPTKPSVTERVVARVLGYPVDVVTAALNPVLEVLGAPEDVIKHPVGGREWLLKYLQTDGDIAVQNTKKALKKVYPAVMKGAEFAGDVVEDTAGYWTETPPDQIKKDAAAIGGDAVKAVTDKLGMPPVLDELQQWAEQNVKPVTRNIGREFDRRYALKQLEGQVFDDDPEEGLLDQVEKESGTMAEEGGLLAQDATNLPPSQRPRRGTGWPGPGAGATEDYVPTAPTPTQDDQKTAVAKGSGKSSGSDVAGVPATQLDPATRAGLERVWGKHTYNPAQRRKKYMAQLNNIYRKAMWLDAIAAVSGGQSRSASYIERAVGMMDAMQKFDQEERVYNIWRDVYYDKNGNYDPPKSKKEAAERARRLGANPEETKSIYGWAEEGQDLQQWYRPDGKGGYETTTVKGKKTRPDGEGWIMGNPPVPRTPAKKQYIWAIPPGGTDAVYMDKDVVASQPGWTQSSIDKSGGLYGQSLKQAAQHIKDGNEDAARAVLKQYYARDLMTASLFGDQMDKAIDGLIEDIRASSAQAPAQQQQAAGPATLEEAVEIAIAHPSNAGKNPQEVRFDVEVWWKKNRGGG